MPGDAWSGAHRAMLVWVAPGEASISTSSHKGRGATHITGGSTAIVWLVEAVSGFLWCADIGLITITALTAAIEH